MVRQNSSERTISPRVFEGAAEACTVPTSLSAVLHRAGSGHSSDRPDIFRSEKVALDDLPQSKRRKLLETLGKGGLDGAEYDTQIGFRVARYSDGSQKLALEAHGKEQEDANEWKAIQVELTKGSAARHGRWLRSRAISSLAKKIRVRREENEVIAANFQQQPCIVAERRARLAHIRGYDGNPTQPHYLVRTK